MFGFNIYLVDAGIHQRIDQINKFEHLVAGVRLGDWRVILKFYAVLIVLGPGNKCVHAFIKVKMGIESPVVIDPPIVSGEHARKPDFVGASLSALPEHGERRMVLALHNRSQRCRHTELYEGLRMNGSKKCRAVSILSEKCRTLGNFTFVLIVLVDMLPVCYTLATTMLLSNCTIADTRNLESFVRSEMASRGIPGVQVAVVSKGRVVFEGSFGKASVESEWPVTKSTRFTINSMTKAFTGVALMQLVQDGKVKLEDTLDHYFSGLPTAWQKITIRQIASHTSGLPDLLDSSSQLSKRASTDEVLNFVYGKPMQFEPGSQAAYNQTGYFLIGLLIQKLTGQAFQENFRIRQFRAAALESILFADAEDLVPNRAESYRLEETQLRRVWELFPTNMRTAAGICSTASDLAKWVVAMDRGALLNEESKRQMWTSTPTTSGSFGWGIGWPMIDRPKHRTATSLGGGRNAIFKYLDDDLTVILLSNLMAGIPEDFVDGIAGFFTTSIRADLPTSYNQWLVRRSIEGAPDQSGFDVYKEMVRRLGKLELDSELLIKEGYKRINEEKPSQAVRLFEVAVASNPQYWNAHDSLGDGYFALKDFKKARKSYLKALELNPKDDNAIAQLKLLGN